MKTVWQVEIDDWNRGKLDENFPHTEKFKNVRDVGKHNLKHVDLICGGFPCQDISFAGGGRQGLDGQRSGLWVEYYRIICEMRPRYILIENVPALINNGLERVLLDLAACGYDAEWQTLRASDVGQPTERKRLFVVAYPKSERPFSFPVFQGDRNQSSFQTGIQRHVPTISFDSIGRTFVAIPEHLRMDTGVSFKLSEIGSAIRGYGNAVCPPAAKFIGELIIKFDNNLREAD